MTGHDESFTIQVSLIEGGKLAEILITPNSLSGAERYATQFEAVLDGERLTVMNQSEDANWHQLKGSLDQQAVDRIGDAIDRHYL